MMSLRGTTNGFRFTEALCGVTVPAKRFAVVPLGAVDYACVTNGAARMIARRRKARGFWRLKELKK